MQLTNHIGSNCFIFHACAFTNHLCNSWRQLIAHLHVGHLLAELQADVNLKNAIKLPQSTRGEKQHAMESLETAIKDTKLNQKKSKKTLEGGLTMLLQCATSIPPIVLA